MAAIATLGFHKIVCHVSSNFISSELVDLYVRGVVYFATCSVSGASQAYSESSLYHLSTDPTLLDMPLPSSLIANYALSKVPTVQ